MILAKKGPAETLKQHTRNCLFILEDFKQRLDFLPDIAVKQNLFNLLFWAVLLHDFGKAASGFQAYLKDNGKPWNYRHEILSTLFLPGLPLNDEDRLFVLLAISTHHKDILSLQDKTGLSGKRENGFRVFKDKANQIRENLSELEDIFSSIISRHSDYLDLKVGIIKLPDMPADFNPVFDCIVPFKNKALDGLLSRQEINTGTFMRGLLIACDHLASGGKRGLPPTIPSANRIIEKGGFALYDFQKQAAMIHGSCLLNAPTGKGKTEAALLWADNNQNRARSRRVFYVLPYTASINAMYERLQNDWGLNEEQLGIVHGRSLDYIYRALSEISDDHYKNALQAKRLNNLARLIYCQVKITTPYQLLNAFFGCRRFEVRLTEMAGGLFIFDEIHAYDPHVTALILEMIKYLAKNLGAKFLIMSATMPLFLREMFNEVVGSDAFISPNREYLQSQSRHKIKIIPGDIIENINLIESCLLKGKRPLIVCNQVDRSIEAFKLLSKKYDDGCLLHSRFTIRDRREKEKLLEKASFLVGTQAIEVSLDIDYDVLFTEPAPVDALLQRFGRVNRKGEKGLAGVNIFEDGSGLKGKPYPTEVVERSLSALNKVDMLYEQTARGLVEEVYANGYDLKEQKEFDDARKNFIIHLGNIAPFIESETEPNLENLYKSIEVVPFQYQQEFHTCIEEKRYLDSHDFVLSIPIYLYGKLKRANLIISEQKTLLVQTEYDNELGLLTDKPISPCEMI